MIGMVCPPNWAVVRSTPTGYTVPDALVAMGGAVTNITAVAHRRGSEPALIMVVLGVLIGGMVIAMYLPIFKMGQAV